MEGFCEKGLKSYKFRDLIYPYRIASKFTSKTNTPNVYHCFNFVLLKGPTKRWYLQTHHEGLFWGVYFVLDLNIYFHHKHRVYTVQKLRFLQNSYSPKWDRCIF